MFVLTRDGHPLYAGTEFQWALTEAMWHLTHRGYPAEVIESIKGNVDQGIHPIIKLAHPYLKEDWRITSVFAD